MKLIIQRANQDFGPYPLALVEQYIAQGSLLPHDLARKEGEPVSASLPLGKLLAQCGGANPLAGNPFQTALQNLKSFDPRLLFPWGTIRSFSWLKDRRLIYLASVGLAPAIVLTLAPGIWAGYWAVALYFSALWALFFYYLFRTPQVTPKLCFLCFGFTAIVSISLLLMVQRIWPWSALMAMAQSASFPPRLFGMFLGVGINEELCKAAILFWLVRRPGVQFVPQTAVFYGMISGLGFGIYEGVHYQMGINRGAGVDGAYLLNIARLTSLPFLHAVWTGIAGYFIGFAALYPRKRYGLWVVSIGVPAMFHAIYNTFGWGFFGLGSALLSVVLLNTYLANVQQMQRQLAAP
ncbi:MAG: PrsW family glutamic-type intramembrane protease [Chthoniobacteraceae bacterium]